MEAFLKGNLSVILILISLMAGVGALMMTPREEDPQIVVPVADVFIHMPGASAAEVERQVASRLEKLLYQIDGVKNVYSMSFPSMAVVTVRFFVGEDRERSWVKLYNKIRSNIDQVPPGVSGWVVKPVEIDDVPIINITLYSSTYSDYDLRRMAEELQLRLQGVKDAGVTSLVGGRPRQITVRLSPQAMAARGISLQDIERVDSRGRCDPAGGESGDGTTEEIRLDAGRFLMSAAEVENLVIGVRNNRPVFLKEVASVQDGPADPGTYTRISLRPKGFFVHRSGGRRIPAAGDRTVQGLSRGDRGRGQTERVQRRVGGRGRPQGDGPLRPRSAPPRGALAHHTGLRQEFR